MEEIIAVEKTDRYHFNQIIKLCSPPNNEASKHYVPPSGTPGLSSRGESADFHTHKDALSTGPSLLGKPTWPLFLLVSRNALCE